MSPDRTLEAAIRRRIASGEQISVATYMALCLADPEFGYYRTRDPIGRAGDFITAPETTQMFGELIGVWSAEVWRQMGEPELLRLIELGPGRGTLMVDALRAAKVRRPFRDALVVHLVETSPVLRERQEAALAETDGLIHWHDRIEDVPPGPAVVIANEFFDALPVHQAVKTANGWRERIIIFGEKGGLAFGHANAPMPLFDRLLPASAAAAEDGAVFEWRSDAPVRALARRLVREGGAALVIDYGHLQSALGETLQAVSEHQFADPLTRPGLIDLTAHVDFAALAEAARTAGAQVHGPVTQGAFLDFLGLRERARALKDNSRLEKYPKIDDAVARLTDEKRGGMGGLFKAIGLSHPDLDELPGLSRIELA